MAVIPAFMRLGQEDQDLETREKVDAEIMLCFTTDIYSYCKNKEKLVEALGSQLKDLKRVLEICVQATCGESIRELGSERTNRETAKVKSVVELCDHTNVILTFRRHS